MGFLLAAIIGILFFGGLVSLVLWGTLNHPKGTAVITLIIGSILIGFVSAVSYGIMAV